jgi:hypothetical protein
MTPAEPTVFAEDKCPAEEKASNLTPFLPRGSYLPSKSGVGVAGEVLV